MESTMKTVSTCLQTIAFTTHSVTTLIRMASIQPAEATTKKVTTYHHRISKKNSPIKKTTKMALINMAKRTSSRTKKTSNWKDKP